MDFSDKYMITFRDLRVPWAPRRSCSLISTLLGIFIFYTEL